MTPIGLRGVRCWTSRAACGSLEMTGHGSHRGRQRILLGRSVSTRVHPRELWVVCRGFWWMEGARDWAIFSSGTGTGTGTETGSRLALPQGRRPWRGLRARSAPSAPGLVDVGAPPIALRRSRHAHEPSFPHSLVGWVGRATNDGRMDGDPGHGSGRGWTGGPVIWHSASA